MLKKITPTRVNIGDVDYAIYPFGAFESAGIGGDLGRFVGPLLAAALPFLDGGVEGLLNTDIEKVMPTIVSALRTLDSDSVQHILMELLVNHSNIGCEYREDDGRAVKAQLTKELADDLFIGTLSDMIRLAVEVVKVNYSGFFTGLTTQDGNLADTFLKRASTITENTVETKIL